jgi:CTD kinase subunit gamma
MDPFEARLQFIKVLQRLNASTQANDAAILFVLKNHDLEEDLYSCVLEELDKSSLNARLNIFYFLEALCENPDASSRVNYSTWMCRDIQVIVDKVVPSNNVGVVNVSPSRHIVENLYRKGLLSVEKYENVVKLLKSREELLESSKVIANVQDTTAYDSTGSLELSNKDILRRMDEDRERTKRIKENIWAIDYKQDGDSEFNILWKSLGPLGRLDYEQMQDDNEMCTASIYVELPRLQ